MKIDCTEEETFPLNAQVNPLLFNPKTSKPINPHDIDGLIDGLEEVKKSLAMVFNHKDVIEAALCKHAEGLKTKTRRVQGEHRIARIEMPSERQNGGRLKAIAESKEFKLIWPQFIRIKEYGIKMREFNKAKNTKGTEEWNAYRDAVNSAILEPTAKPRVVIEK